MKNIEKPVVFLLSAFFPQNCLLCGDRLYNINELLLNLCRQCGRRLTADGYGKNAHNCAYCGRTLISEQDSCLECRQRLTEEPEMVKNSAIFPYYDRYRLLLHYYKFYGWRRGSLFFAARIAGFYRRCCQGYLVVPIPAQPANRRRRGFDQMRLICRHLRADFAIEYADWLRRRAGNEQKKLDRQQRRQNLADKFYLSRSAKRENMTDRRILLLDDLYTTGATINAAAAMFRQTGCQTVRSLTIAVAE